MPGLRDLLQQVAAAAADLLAGLQRGLDGDEVQLGTIHVRLDRAHKFARQSQVAGGMTGLDHGLQLPVVGDVGVVVDSVGQRHGRLAFTALRTQAQIDAKHRPFASVPRQQFGGLLRQANEIFAVRNFHSRRLRSAVIQVKKIDVGAVVQLVAAQLSQ